MKPAIFLPLLGGLFLVSACCSGTHEFGSTPPSSYSYVPNHCDDTNWINSRADAYQKSSCNRISDRKEAERAARYDYVMAYDRFPD